MGLVMGMTCKMGVLMQDDNYMRLELMTGDNMYMCEEIEGVSDGDDIQTWGLMMHDDI
jgi:hypothetical protein